MSETYISVDIESDGPIPGPNSMLSLGAAAFNERGDLLDTFSRNFDLLEGAQGHPDTMAWWKTQPEAWYAHRQSTLPPKTIMTQFHTWLKQFPNPVFVGYPAGYDFLFVYWYLIKFVGNSPFSFSALDIKSYVMGKTWVPYKQCVKHNFPKKWFKRVDVKHSHIALEDAIGQGQLFIGIKQDV